VLLLALLGNDANHFFSLVLGPALSAETSPRQLDCLLLPACDSGPDQLHKLLLERGEPADLANDFSNDLNSLAEFSLLVGGSRSLLVDLWLGDNEALVKTHEDSSLALHRYLY